MWVFTASEGSSQALSSSPSCSPTPSVFRTNREKNENRKGLNWGKAFVDFWVGLWLTSRFIASRSEEATNGTSGPGQVRRQPLIWARMQLINSVESEPSCGQSDDGFGANSRRD